MKLEAKLVEINKTHYKSGVNTTWGIDDVLIKELAREGWQMTTTISLAAVSRANIILGLFYRRVEESAKKVEKPKEKKVDA